MSCMTVFQQTVVTAVTLELQVVVGVEPNPAEKVDLLIIFQGTLAER